ncbi:GDSL-type esterase/lipase family protein [Robertkochia aurantiaca]|uniref:GDSL-type esterase/lipase family protein n=1 Tax=Robertkochia aurantiaca TaxID=2873700 RepID=UPI001CCDF6B7|nr:GDSL-type esterase/lipase family protein [Robertkochia sp. 3YJGBD-33]
MSRPLIFSLLIFICCPVIQAQHFVLDSVIDSHPYMINMEANRFIGAEESAEFKNFLIKMDSIFEGKREKLHIFHIGGSHIQADFYSNKLRTYLQNMNEVSTAQRGFVFPYHLADTNNPLNYRVEADDDSWKGYRCSQGRDSVAWGLAGVTAVFEGNIDTINIRSNYKNYNSTPYCFDGLRVFYNSWNENFDLNIDEEWLVSDTLNPEANYREYRFKYPMDEVDLVVSKRPGVNDKEPFLLMGLEFINDRSGIEYTSIGANGAKFDSYERCALFEKQLSLYKPDLFIISIGTNDAYTRYFDGEKYRAQYEDFIRMIKNINPECAILLTVPNDAYFRQRYPNPHTGTQERIILEIAAKHKLPVWDLYRVMGGQGSSQHWYEAGLMVKDRVHFSLTGYSVKADLLLQAFLQAWEETTQRPEKSLLTYFKSIGE